MAFFYPRFVANEFNPVFRLLNDVQAVSRPSRQQCGRAQCGRAQQKVRWFQPRFDVTENKDSYELKGELPGIDQKNIEIAFTDEKTLTIKGHTESHREEGTHAATQPASETEKTPATEQTDSASFHKASVEDEYVDVGESDTTMSGGNPEATPAETPKEVTSEEPQQQPTEVAAPTQTERTKYWVSERSIGRFSRTWSFPKRVDQEQVSASLKDGILSIVVPKAAVPENKRISIQ